MYLILCKHVYSNEVKFIIESSLTRARKSDEVPRYEDGSGYQTYWKLSYACKTDTIKHAREFAPLRAKSYEFKTR